MQIACCGDWYKIGCFTSCDEVESGLVAAVAGVHTILYMTKGVLHEVETDALGIGDEIVFENIFRETGASVFQILDPNQNNFIHTDGGENYDKFYVENYIHLT